MQKVAQLLCYLCEESQTDLIVKESCGSLQLSFLGEDYILGEPFTGLFELCLDLHQLLFFFRLLASPLPCCLTCLGSARKVWQQLKFKRAAGFSRAHFWVLMKFQSLWSRWEERCVLLARAASPRLRGFFSHTDSTGSCVE